MYRALLWLIASGVVLLLAGMVLVVTTPQGRTAYHTALFITQIVPALPRITVLQQAPIRVSVVVPTPEGNRRADLYRPPGEGPFAATVLFLGVAPAGPDDKRVVNLAEGLARTGMVTLVYWSPEKIGGRVHAPDIANLEAAHAFLRDQPFVEPDRVGFAGFCVGASFVLMAAAQPRTQPYVAFVNAFGPYYDLRDLVLAFGTKTQPSREGLIAWEPDRLTAEVARRMLRESIDEARAYASPSELSSYEAAVNLVLQGGDELQVRRAVPKLPPHLLARIDQVSPKTYLNDLRIPVMLMHDRADTLMPADGSRQIARVLASDGEVRHTEFSLFQHVDATRSLNPWEMTLELAKLFKHLHATLSHAR